MTIDIDTNKPIAQHLAGQEVGGLPPGYNGDPNGKLDLYPYTAYAENAAVWDFMLLSYNAGAKYKDGEDSEGNKLFQKHNKENDKKANLRKGRSSTPGYARFFVQRFDGYLSRAEVTGRAWDNPKWEKFSESVTVKKAKSWGEFIRSWQHAALIMSPAWAQVIVPNFDPSKVVSLADEKEAGIEMKVALVDPRNIIDYEYNGDELIRLVVREWDRQKASITSREMWAPRYIEWTLTEINIYYGDPQGNLDAGQDPPFKVEGLYRTMPNANGVIPYVPLNFFDPDESNPVFSPSMIHDVSNWQRDVFRVLSLLYEEIFNRTFTTQVLTGANPKDINGQEHSTLLVISNPLAKLQTSGSDTKQTEALLETLHFMMRQLFRVAQFEASGDTKESRTAESGAKKSRDLEGLYTVLGGFAERSEAAENQLRKLWARLSGITEDPPTAKHNRDFDVRAIEDDVEAITSMELAEFPESFLKAFKERVIRKVMPGLNAKEAKEIEKELEEIGKRRAEEARRVTSSATDGENVESSSSDSRDGAKAGAGAGKP